jgi:hypothetical protein
VFERVFTIIRRVSATPRPGIRVKRLWSFDSAALLDSHKRSVGEVRDSINTALRALGEPEIDMKSADAGSPAQRKGDESNRDEINRLSGSQALTANVDGDCTLGVYEGVLHHPHNDLEARHLRRCPPVARLARRGCAQYSPLRSRRNSLPTCGNASTLARPHLEPIPRA